MAVEEGTELLDVNRTQGIRRCEKWDLTFDMSGGAKGAKRPLGRPLDGGVRPRLKSGTLGLRGTQEVLHEQMLPIWVSAALPPRRADERQHEERCQREEEEPKRDSYGARPK